jgi:hypothetical protein
VPLKSGGKKQWFLRKMVEQSGGFIQKWWNKVPPLYIWQGY